MSQQQALFDTQPDPWSLDDQGDWLAARVVFSQRPYGPYDYSVPDEIRGRLKPGQRVKVPLGRGNRSIQGYCVELISPGDPAASTVNPSRMKPIAKLIDDQPLMTPALLDLGKWISHRWHCPLGVTIETIVPVAVRDHSNTRETIFLASDPDVMLNLDEMKLSPKQRKALEVLFASRDSLTPAELARAAGCTTAPIMSLRKKKLVRESTVRIERRSHELEEVLRKPNLPLNRDQKAALDLIENALNQNRHESILLHGITGSGKTEGLYPGHSKGD